MSFLPGKALLGFAVVTPALVFLAIAAAGWTYAPAKILFPYTMVASAFTGGITQWLLVAGMFQYLLYGVILDWARSAGRFRAGWRSRPSISSR